MIYEKRNIYVVQCKNANVWNRIYMTYEKRNYMTYELFYHAVLGLSLSGRIRSDGFDCEAMKKETMELMHY